MDRIIRTLAFIPLLLSACNPGSRPRLLTDPAIIPGVWGILQVPASPGPHPGVILIPGSGGWRPGYTTFAKAFADSGYVVLTIDYYAVTGRGSTKAEEMHNWPAWLATVHNAIAYLQASPLVAGQPVALVGYSRGAMLAISAGAYPPRAAAIVDFYGAGSDDDPPDSLITVFPPLLILHGDADSNIPVSQAQRLFDRLHARNADVVMHRYVNAGHGFNTPWSNEYSPAEAEDSWARTMAFLRSRLQPAAQP